MPTARPIYLLSFLFSLQLAAVGFFGGPFLIEYGVPEEWLGVLYAACNFVGIIGLALTPLLMQRAGNFSTFVGLSALLGGTFLLLPFMTSYSLLVLAFMIITVTSLILYLSMDVFLEVVTKDEETTGRVRGMFMTAANIAYVLMPIAGGFLVIGGIFHSLFLFLAGVMLAIVFIAALYLSRTPESEYRPLSTHHLWALLKKNADIRNIFVAQFVLRIFYAGMTVYMPIYLTQYLGFSLQEMSLIFAIAMIPFAVIELPLGILADRYLGEKEILIAGMVWLGCMTVAFSIVSSAVFVLWATIMFVSRVGAAAVEIMSEVYFFKHTQGVDADAVSAFRILYPVAYIIGPLLGSLFLLFFEMRYIFAAIAAVVFTLGLHASLHITDTR